MGFRLQRKRRRRLVEDPDLGHVLSLGANTSVGVLLPLRVARMVSGEPGLMLDVCKGPSCMVMGVIRLDGFLIFQDLRASLATRWQTPNGGAIPGSILKGVTVGSCRYSRYVDHRCLSISGVQLGRFCLNTPHWFSSRFVVKADKRLALFRLREENLIGSGASLSGLVQLPSAVGYDVRLPDSSDESETREHVDSGRMMLSPRSCRLFQGLAKARC